MDYIQTQWNDLIRPYGMYTGLKPKVCQWCSTYVHDGQPLFFERVNEHKHIFCSKDCMLEYKDWRSVSIFPKKPRKIIQKKTWEERRKHLQERKRKWYLKNKHRMVEFRKNKKLKQNESK